MSLGIDIGIKNLSLCIIHDNQIKLWDIYSVMEEYFCLTCKKNAKFSFEGNYYCGIHSRKMPKKKTINNKVKSLTLQQIATKIIIKLTEVIDANEDLMRMLKLVTLELQPKVNPKMKFASHIIFCMLCKFFIHSKTKIKFEKASIKLKNFKEKNSFAYTENNYKNRKNRAIEYTIHCLKNSRIGNGEDYIDFFQSKKKKDDLSDSFLLSYNNFVD